MYIFETSLLSICFLPMVQKGRMSSSHNYLLSVVSAVVLNLMTSPYSQMLALRGTKEPSPFLSHPSPLWCLHWPTEFHLPFHQIRDMSLSTVRKVFAVRTFIRDMSIFPLFWGPAQWSLLKRSCSQQDEMQLEGDLLPPEAATRH